MHIDRKLFQILRDKIDYKKAIFLLGPRQVGKTTLVKKLAGSISDEFYI